MTLTSQNVLDALSTVIDPEIRRPITDLNMVDEVVIDGSTVSVTILLTTAGCPLRNTWCPRWCHRCQSDHGCHE